MGAEGEAADALESARRRLAARDAELARADRALIAAVADIHALAVDSISRLESIASDVESVLAGRPADSPAAAREISRYLVDRNRDAAEVVGAAAEAVQAKTFALEQLTSQYQPPAAP